MSKVVYVDGTFDLLHSGHIKFLKMCKTYGDYLIVGVTSDKDVESYKRTPIIDMENRKIILENLSIVDKVIAPAPFMPIPNDFLEKHKINVVIYTSPDGKPAWEEHYKHAIDRGIMIFGTYGHNNLSTTKIINKIKNM